MEEKKYEINGKTYVQRPLVLGQWRQLMEVVATMPMPEEFNTASIVIMLGSELHRAMAVILTEEGKSPRDKNLEELASELEFTMDAETAMEAVDHFFALNPMSSISEKTAAFRNALLKMMEGIGSPSSASPAPEATSPKESGASGT